MDGNSWKDVDVDVDVVDVVDVALWYSLAPWKVFGVKNMLTSMNTRTRTDGTYTRPVPTRSSIILSQP